jgi:chemotaxis methyl-accepting protein methylase
LTNQLNTQIVEKPSSTNQIPFEDFNKFNISKVESSEINNRELKTTKLIKNPITDLEELGIEEIGKYAYSLAKDQAGCRFLQKKLDENPSLANDIFPKLMDKLIELMNDSFGNYLIQKVLEKLSDEGIHETLNAVINTIKIDFSTFFRTRIKPSWN